MREVDSVAAVLVLTALAAVDGAGGPPGVGGRLGRLADSVRDRMLDVVGPDDIVDRVDINGVVERVDVNALLARVDINALLARVDVETLLARVDVNRLLARVDVNALLARVDVNALLARVDINTLLADVDVNALLADADVDALLARVDVVAVVDRIDPDHLLARVDIDALVDRVDVERVVQRAGIPEIVAESTGSLFESGLDLLRRQLLALDVVLARGIMRVRGRDDASVPAGPSGLAGDGGPAHALPAPNAPVTDVTGHYAGAVTRLIAHLLDVAIATGAFTVTTGALSSLLRTFSQPVDNAPGVLYFVGLVLWLFLYWFASTAVAGRTPGMAVVGLRIVDRTGDPLSGRQAFKRVLVLPISVASVIGLAGILLDPERRTLHDLAGGSTVVYDWGDRTATLPTPLARWLAQHAAPIDQ